MVFPFVFLLLLEKAGVFFQYFYTKFYLCHEHFRLCAMSTDQVFTPFEEFEWV